MSPETCFTDINFDLHNSRTRLGVWCIEFIGIFTTKDIRHFSRMMKVFKCLPDDQEDVRIIRVVTEDEWYYSFSSLLYRSL